MDHDEASRRRGYVGTHTVGQNTAEAEGIRTRQNEESQAASDAQITGSLEAPPANWGAVSTGGDGPSALGVLMMVGIGVAVFAILYPFTVGAAIAAASMPSMLLRLFVANPEPWQLLVTAVTSVILGVWMLRRASRFDQQLAERPWYRVVRHVLRLAILAAMMVGAVNGMSPSAANAQAPDHDSAVVVGWAVVGVGLLGAHLFLRRCDVLQETWHEMLTDWGFRS